MIDECLFIENIYVPIVERKHRFRDACERGKKFISLDRFFSNGYFRIMRDFLEININIGLRICVVFFRRVELWECFARRLWKKYIEFIMVFIQISM